MRLLAAIAVVLVLLLIVGGGAADGQTEGGQRSYCSADVTSPHEQINNDSLPFFFYELANNGWSVTCHGTQFWTVTGMEVRASFQSGQPGVWARYSWWVGYTGRYTIGSGWRAAHAEDVALCQYPDPAHHYRTKLTIITHVRSRADHSVTAVDRRARYARSPVEWLCGRREINHA